MAQDLEQCQNIETLYEEFFNKKKDPLLREGQFAKMKTTNTNYMKNGGESLNLSDRKWMLNVIDTSRFYCWNDSQVVQLDILEAIYINKEAKITVDDLREHLRLIDKIYA